MTRHVPWCRRSLLLACCRKLGAVVTVSCAFLAAEFCAGPGSRLGATPGPDRGLHAIFGSRVAHAQTTGTAKAPERTGLDALFSGLESEAAAGALDPDLLDRLASAAASDRADPNWPMTIFLLAEIFRLRGDEKKSLGLARDLALWATDDPYGDAWGGSGLAIVSLWRWQQALAAQETPDPTHLIEALEAGEKLVEQRLVAGMFKNAIFDALPQLDEEVRRAWPKLAWAAGNQLRAQRLFIDFLRTVGASDLDTQEQELLEEVSKSNLISHDWLQMLRGKRLLELRHHRNARELLEKAFASENPEVRAEAGLSLAEAVRATDPRSFEQQVKIVSDVIDDAIDPYVAQKALLTRGYLYKRAGRGDKMLADFTKLTDDYPIGPFTDDALVELARYHQNRGDLDRALGFYTRLQNFSGENDWADTAVYQPAIALYTRGRAGDLEQAYAMLQGYEERAGPGPVRRIALFWLGRIAGELGLADDSEGYLRQTIAEMPYDYYALRARMHLNAGTDARHLIDPDPATNAALAKEFAASRVDDMLKESSPYMRRLADARTTGLYAAALAANDRFRIALRGKRAAAISLADLDNNHFLAPLAVLMALRQDALGAKDGRPTARQRLNVAGALVGLGDVAFAIHVAAADGEKYEWRGEAQQNQRFLATAYPQIFRDYFQEAAREHGLSPALLYAVARRESSFDPRAVSSSDAIGLFQFTKLGFADMNEGNRLLRAAGIETREEYLVDPRRSIRLGAAWFSRKKLPGTGGNLVLAVMAHNAGGPRVRDSQSDWEAMGRGDDIEFMVETARARSARQLARRVLADYAIVRAAGLFKSE